MVFEIPGLKDSVHPDEWQLRLDLAACVLHTHTRAGVAIRDDEKARLQADLGRANFLMLRNHGLLTVGKSIADAFLSMYTFENTCRIQIDVLAGQVGVQDLTA